MPYMSLLLEARELGSQNLIDPRPNLFNLVVV